MIIITFEHLNLQTIQKVVIPIFRADIMLRTSQQSIQDSSQINEKIIIDPLQLLSHELQSKQMKNRKQSIQTVYVIALTMNETQIVHQLLPFLLKVVIQESSKQIKALVIKSFKMIAPLLNRQESYIKLLQTIFDVLIVFEEQQVRTQAVSALNFILFQNEWLDFEKLKPCLYKLVFQELNNISEVTYAKNAKQLCIYLVKYLLKNLKASDQSQIVRIIVFLQNQFLLKPDDQYLSTKILAQNFHILVQQWPTKFLSDLKIFIGCLFDFRVEKAQTQGTQDATQQSINQDIKDVSSGIRSCTKLPKQIVQELKLDVVSTLVRFSDKYGSHQAYPYLSCLFEQSESRTKCLLIKRFKEIFEAFAKQDLQPLLLIFTNFTDQHHDIKKSILQVLDEIPFEDSFKSQVIIQNCKNSLQLKNILIQTLIRVNKSQAVSQILSQSDYDFKIKIFTKLPDSLLHKNQMYALILDSLLSEPKKNFRSKLNIILNIVSRLQPKINYKGDVSESFDISYLVPVLTKYFSDKIAIVRTNIAKLCALLLQIYDVQFQLISGQLNHSFYGIGKNWFQRQTVLLMIKYYLQYHYHGGSIHSKLKNNPKSQDLYQFILKVTQDAVKGIQVVNQNDGIISDKINIKNISSLAQEIIKNYSL